MDRTNNDNKIGRISKVYSIAKLMRIKHYIKNLMIFIPLIFSMNLTCIRNIFQVVVAFISFSLAASTIYIINDIADVDKDRKHLIKKKRPIASGEITVPFAIGICMLVFVVSILFAYSINLKLTLIIIIYIVMNILYSYYLKNIPIIDVSIIALGFILRVMAGAYAIEVPPSRWLILTIMSLSFYLGFGKRRNELIKVNNSEDTRQVLKGYNINFLDKAMNSMMTLSIVFYSLWTIDFNVISSITNLSLLITVPIVIIGMFRYSLIIEGDSYADPTDVILSDRLLQLIIIVFVIYIILLYI